MTARRWVLASAGMTLAPAAWAANMQWGQLAPYFDCARGSRLNVLLSLVGMVVALGSAGLSWSAAPATAEADSARAQAFTANVGCLTGAIFAYALLLHAAAGLFLTGCER